MTNIKYKVCVLTVTYGNRWAFLGQVLKRVLSFEQVSQVIIVNNASDYEVIKEVQQLADNRLQVIDNAENKGSAGGYKQAIEYAHRFIDTDFIWLLDDDNLPDENALKKLLQKWDEIPGGNNEKALFCLRGDRKPHVKIAQGENPYRYYLVPDNFLGFSLPRIFYNQFLKLQDKLKKPAAFKDHVPIPYVPYGGLLMQKLMIDKIGYPDERFFLYVDDSEYTYRITESRGTIWLIPECRVTDVDQSQGINYQKKLFTSNLLDQWNFRIYYHTRNRLFFYTRVTVKNKLLFKLNKFLFLNGLKLISIINAKQKEYKKLLIAVNDGLKGNLGKADPNKF
ncbi:glycosyltransferase family 2 protein [Mucilaginibacter arboris]|uniref:Glycosyltransferase n=1 Tax=Mucilaginibacter arboris TaxID=2682090 RepID=A0A7K1SRQ8_9SPHI|nr:glycosyltransferase [Mucilaginibacter arboris]MVN20006.1 glycosyltransferase [Mucilaginibacter arboris]